MKSVAKLKKVMIPVILIVPALICSYKLKEKEARTRPCLEISGQVVSATNGPTSTARVYLIEENQVIDSLYTEPNKVFKFKLSGSRFYALRIVQAGYVPRLVSISTYLPHAARPGHLYKFHFDLYQLCKEEGTDALNDLLDFPIAVIQYDRAKGYFDYNEAYTEHIKSAFYKLKLVTR